MKLEELNLTGRTYNCLRRSGIETVEQLRKLTDEELRQLKRVGPKTVTEIKETMASDLSPCPYCGGKAVLEQIPDSDLWTAGCNDDDMCWGNINHVTMVFCTREGAARAWNMRAVK